MITKVTHTSVFVLDQDSAYDYYVNKLSFKVRVDNPISPDFCWLTVGPKEQPNFELILLPIKEGSFFKKDKISIIKDLVKNGTLGGIVVNSQSQIRIYSLRISSIFCKFQSSC